MGSGELTMCYFGELDGIGFIERFIQMFFLTAGCVVNYTGLLLAILLIGFSAFIYLWLFCFSWEG